MVSHHNKSDVSKSRIGLYLAKWFGLICLLLTANSAFAITIDNAGSFVMTQIEEGQCDSTDRTLFNLGDTIHATYTTPDFFSNTRWRDAVAWVLVDGTGTIIWANGSAVSLDGVTPQTSMFGSAIYADRDNTVAPYTYYILDTVVHPHPYSEGDTLTIDVPIAYENTFDPGQLDPGCPTLVSSESEEEITEGTQQRIQNFMGKRMSLLAAHRPDLAGLLTGDGLGGGLSNFTGGPAGISFNGDKEDLRKGNFSFNLQQFVNTINQANQHDELMVSRASGADAGPGVQNPLQSAYNIWIKGSWVNADEDRGNIDEEIDFYTVHVGADYRYSKDTLIGVMGQFDRTEAKSTALGSETEGDGWMIGPYLVTRLTDTLILDLHGSWGQSDNEVNPLGTSWDDFDAERWQLAGNLTGSYDSGPWHISPSIGLVYFEETQEAYTDSNGFRIGEQTFDLGSLNFGPTFTYRIERSNGMVIRPLIGLKGIYDFNSPDITAVSGQAIGTDDFRAQLTVGLNVLTSGGSTLQATYTHDGIGVSDFESHTGQIIFSTPINRLTDGASLKGVYSLSGSGQFDNDDDVSQGVNLSVNIPYD